jgi:group I intron endonuclease
MSFIYKTTNTINGKIYIGKSKLNDPAYLGSGMILRQAIQKYGITSFVKEIIEECADEVVNDREKFWIGYYKSFERGVGYNIALGGSGGDTTTHHPDKDVIVEKRKHGLSTWHETMTETQKTEHGNKISAAKKGKSNGREGYKHSSESIDKIKNNQPPKTDEWAKTHAEAMAKRRGTSLTKKYKRVIVDGVEYESVKHAVAGLGLKYAKYFHDMRRSGKIKVEYI